jgi:hypothetical protein
LDQERWRTIEKRMKTMEDRVIGGGDEGGVSMVSEGTLTLPVNERMLKENLRKFVAAKVTLRQFVVENHLGPFVRRRFVH